MDTIKHVLMGQPQNSAESHHDNTNIRNPAKLTQISTHKMQSQHTSSPIIKQIIIPEQTKIKSTEQKKPIEPKEPQKRQITTTDKWQFTDSDLQQANQYMILYDTSKTHFVYQQIKNKLSSYRCQDIEKNLFNGTEFADLSGVLQKMENCRLLCFYCKESVLLLYENVREPKQWTLERIDNKQGHTMNNVEIACLSCNLRRRTMYHERYIMTKNIKNIKKV